MHTAGARSMISALCLHRSRNRTGRGDSIGDSHRRCRCDIPDEDATIDNAGRKAWHEGRRLHRARNVDENEVLEDGGVVRRCGHIRARRGTDRHWRGCGRRDERLPYEKCIKSGDNGQAGNERRTRGKQHRDKQEGGWDEHDSREWCSNLGAEEIPQIASTTSFSCTFPDSGPGHR